ncbi:MAG: hypothetical protein OEQ28_15770 [Acidobacteriota bacterium]|nr:hypothetical protein [Acidobacteriota bacterium]
MNGLKCPKCGLVNLLTAESCHRCNHVFTDSAPATEVSVPVEETFQARSYASGADGGIPEDNETGRKTFFWYRVYCAVMLLLYVALMALGLLSVVISGDSVTPEQQQEAFIVGIIYFVLGLAFAAVYGIALVLPRKPFNWIYGIVMIAIGLTSCCLLPATVPLFLFWLKPETKRFFGRK